MNKRDESLKLDNQLCFPIYALSRVMTQAYKPFLDKLDLTYPQYLVMLVLWEKKELSVKELGDLLLLDSGTLTPLLKRMEQREIISRARSSEDERKVFVAVTEKGQALKEEAVNVPKQMLCRLDMTEGEANTFRKDLHKLINKLNIK